MEVVPKTYLAPGKVCRGNPGFCGLPREDQIAARIFMRPNSWDTPGHQARKRGAKAQSTNNSVGPILMYAVFVFFLLRPKATAYFTHSANVPND